MGLPRRFLGENENVVFHMRTHWKRIFGHVLLGLLIIAAAVAGTIFMPAEAQPIASYIIWGIAVIALFPATISPLLKWLSSTFTITDRRIITRTGILHKKGHDIPLGRISNVSYEHSMWDRIFGCGTLILQTSADEPLHLDDIPRVERVHVQMTEMLFVMDQNDH
ncbi:MAG: PH domain-containing protein [Gulosibacter sp.]|uniref:PH domain-containing protein n=1 Tax=Gulosibacter sp. TaxID=2817531 RepID=UPI003F8E11F5